MTLVAAVPASRAFLSPPANVGEQPLARRADEQWKAERLQFAEPGHELEILLAPLGEAEARIEHDLSLAHTGLARDLQRFFEEEELVGDHIGKSFAVASGMHDDEAGASFGRQPGDVGLALQAVDVVDDMRAGGDRQPRRLGPVGVDGDDEPAIGGERFDDRQDPRLLLLRRNRSSARPGGFAADIDDCCAFCGHETRMRHGLVRCAELPAIGKTVRRHVQNAHQPRLGAEFKLPSVGKLPEFHDGLCYHAKRLLRNKRA